MVDDVCMNTCFSALVVRKNDMGGYSQSIEQRHILDLPKNDVLIRVQYSSLNYKDCMSYVGNPGITRKFPHTPGLDAAGLVVASNSKNYKIGDEVIIVSRTIGVSSPGGFGQYLTCPADWLLHLPHGLSLRESMIIGTAGFTAALAVDELLQSRISPDMGSILVSGATGGVGLISIAILSKLGFKVSASTGKPEATKLLYSAGAAEVIDREMVNDVSGRGLLSAKWIGGIDTVGGNVLSTMLKGLKHEGTVVATGIIQSQDLNTSILPLVLRGVRLIGVNAEGKSHSVRSEIWGRIATIWKPLALEEISNEVCLKDLKICVEDMLNGRHSGRTIINLI